METLKKIESVCPDCFRKDGEINRIDGTVVEDGGKVYIDKECDEHGEFREIFWDDVKLYRKANQYFETGVGVTNPQVESFDCPHDCGLCAGHKSQSVLTNLTVTNRCNLRCSYCFANAGAQGFVFEPSKEELREQMRQIREEKPVPGKAIQLTGGEPTVRDDLVDIVEMAGEEGFTHIQLNTNGIKLADDPEFCKELREAGVDTVYMSFDGLDEETNPWIQQNKRAIENAREAELGVVLVPVVIDGHNDDQLGDIIEFALDNLDVIRGVNFQPVSFVGRIENLDDERRKEERITYSGMIEKVEEQMDGDLKARDWYSVPFVLPVSKLIENLKGEKQVEFTCSPSCGGATYLFYEDGDVKPINDFVDVEGLMDFLEAQAQKGWPFKKLRILLSTLRNLGDYIDEERAPESLNIKKMIKDALVKGDYGSIGDFHKKSLYVGSMWFQDVWTMNLDRLERCVIHYATPEGVIPFCAYNGLGYKDEIQEKHSVPVEEWEGETGKKMKDDLWEGGRIS